MSNNLYTPVAGGFAQDTYTDQMGTALPGSLYSASDTTLVDAAIVSDAIGPFGLTAGVAIVLGTPKETDSRVGINSTVVELPSAANKTIYGVTIRNQQMDSNANGEACWFGGRLCNIMRPTRAGGRMWIPIAKGADPTVGLFVIVADATGHGLPIGSFTLEAIGADTEAVTNIKAVSALDNNNLILVEMGV